jgi:hypothetical protein
MAGDSRLGELIRAGETSRVEFKASFRFDLKERKVNKDLTQVVAKTIAGFVNSEGGTLLIGVTDEAQVVGIDHDIETLTKKSLDGFELALRTAVGKFLGVDVSAEVGVQFAVVDGKQVAEVACQRHAEPVFLRDGDQYTFYVRDGNSTRPLNVVEQHKYIKRHYPSSPAIIRDTIREVVHEVLSVQQDLNSRPLQKAAIPKWGEWLLDFFRRSAGGIPSARLPEQVELTQQIAIDQSERPGRARPDSSQLPPWLTVRTRSVLDAYLHALERSPDWKRLHIISPWLSTLDDSFSLTSESLANRLKKYGTTVYVVTRPPIESWHKDAIGAFAATGRANIAIVPDLHAKLYVASTAAGSFALVGSANFTQQSIDNFEIGLLAHSYMEGKQVVSALDREAADIYRTPGRKLIHRARF